jgi:HlyD family type I secretion membrane fusion protein
MAEASGAVPEPPAPASAIRRFGVIVIGAVFGGLALWTVLAPIDGAVIAPGQIVVEASRKAVQHMEGGIVSAIHVRDGDLVEAGATLVELDRTVADANMAMIDGQLAELYARRSRLEAERDGANGPAPPRGVGDVVSSESFKENLAGQAELFAAKENTRTTQIALLDERIVQQRERISGLRIQIKALGDQRALIADELDGVRTLHAEGYAPKTRLRELEREARRLEGESGALRAAVAEAESVIAEARLEITRLKTAGREESITELRDVDASIADLEERRVAASDVASRTRIRAPQSGRVLALNAHTIGGVIAPGSAIMEIVPDGVPLLVAARVSPGDVDKVETGQETLVRFSGLGGRKTPEATGKVKTVSADSLVDEATGIPYYLALIELPAADDLDRSLKGQRLAPGMPAEAYIRTGSQPAIAYLLKPLTDAAAKSLRED